MREPLRNPVPDRRPRPGRRRRAWWRRAAGRRPSHRAPRRGRGARRGRRFRNGCGRPARTSRRCPAGSLRSDVDPGAGRHLPVHHEPAPFELPEVVPVRPAPHQVGVGDEDAGGVGMRPDHPHRFAALDEEGLVVPQVAQGGDDPVVARPVARGLPGPAVDDQVLRPLGDLWIEVVHEHPERGFLDPSPAGEGGAPGGANLVHSLPLARLQGARVRCALDCARERPRLHLRPPVRPQERPLPRRGGCDAPPPSSIGRPSRDERLRASLPDRPRRVRRPLRLPDLRGVLRPAPQGRPAPHRPGGGRGRLAGRRGRVGGGRDPGRPARPGEGDRLHRGGARGRRAAWGGSSPAASTRRSTSPRATTTASTSRSAGRVTGWRYVPGKLWPVNPASVKNVPGLFTVNERLVTLLESPLGLSPSSRWAPRWSDACAPPSTRTVPVTNLAGAGPQSRDYADAHPGGEGAGTGRLRDGLHGDPALRAGPGGLRPLARRGGPGPRGRAHRRSSRLTGPDAWSRTGRVKINGVKGMNDILPGQVGRWQEIERVAREVFALHGYREIRTPVVEPYALYARGVGEATDIVNKEMYVFEDKGEEKLALRPEGTAGTVRAYIEHGAHVDGPQKWFYVGPMFRRERPQKGRYRQFHQIGVEAFGIAEPAIDVEQIAMLADLFRRLGVAPVVHVNSVGDAACRPAYLEELRGWLRERAGALCADCRERTERNPLRVLDCKVPTCQPILAEAPRLLERLCDGCRAHFDAVRQGLDDLGVAYQVNPRLVRGLDYYVRTAYEFTSDALGSQSAVAGGGRYDGLVETLGGPPTPGHRVRHGRGTARAAAGGGRTSGARDAAGGLLRLGRRGRPEGGAAAGCRVAARRRRLRSRRARGKARPAVQAGRAGGRTLRGRDRRERGRERPGEAEGHGDARGDPGGARRSRRALPSAGAPPLPATPPFVAVVAGPTASGKTPPRDRARAPRRGRDPERRLPASLPRPRRGHREAHPRGAGGGSPPPARPRRPGAGDGRSALGRLPPTPPSPRWPGAGSCPSSWAAPVSTSARSCTAWSTRRGAIRRCGRASRRRPRGTDGPRCTGGSRRWTPAPPPASARTISSARCARWRSPPGVGPRASSSRPTGSRRDATATASWPSTCPGRSCTGASGSGRRPWPAEASSRRPGRCCPASAETFPRLPIGYADAVACAEGRIDEEELAARIALQHRRYARRQVIWLRREQDVEWLAPAVRPGCDRRRIAQCAVIPGLFVL